MASAKAKIRHVFGDTFSCRAAPPDMLVELSGGHKIIRKHARVPYLYILNLCLSTTFCRNLVVLTTTF